jgi:hypothetical protein
MASKKKISAGSLCFFSSTTLKFLFMEDHFEISFEADGKKYAGTVYPDYTDEKLHFQLNYHADEDGKSAIVFMEPGDRGTDQPERIWVQRIAMGEQPFLSAGFLEAAGAAIKAHE